MTETVVINNTPNEPTLEEQAKNMGINPEAVDETAIAQSAEERPGWLPEKFKSPEDMANAYAELEKKLGSPKEEVTTPPVDKQEEAPTPSEDEAKEAVENAGLNFDELSAKYWEKGALEDSDYETLEKAGIPRNLVDQFAAGQQAVIQLERQEAFNTVGGEENYTNMVKWAADSLSAQEIETYDKAVNGNDKNARLMAIKGLQARYEAKVGREPGRTVGGKTGTGSQEVYESIAQLQADMKDPRYFKDPAFIRKVEAKLARSNIL